VRGARRHDARRRVARDEHGDGDHARCGANGQGGDRERWV
jgi:hypothetical protein